MVRMISIHALREESDSLVLFIHRLDAISIHALREESDNPGTILKTLLDEFQSTLSVRRATRVLEDRAGVREISIHALREESDGRGRAGGRVRSDFNPRSP